MGLIEHIITEKQTQDIIIAGFGDSLTYGWLVSRGYLDYLHDILKEKYPSVKFKIKNFGVPGDTANDGLRRIDDIVDSKPDVVIVQFALNDAFSGYSSREFGENIARIIDHLQRNTSANLMLATSVPINSPYENKIAEMFYEEILNCGKAKNIPVAMVHEFWKNHINKGISHASLVQGDGVHPVEKGYMLMAQCIASLL